MKIYHNSVAFLQGSIKASMLASMLVAGSVTGFIEPAFAQSDREARADKPVTLITGDQDAATVEATPELLSIEDAIQIVSPETDLPETDLPKTDLPEIDLPEPTARDLTNQAPEITTAETGVPEASVTIGLTQNNDVGLAAIGVRQSADSMANLNELIWRGTPASRAAYLFANSKLTSQSKALATVALEVVAKEAVPPIGANMVARDLVRARLAWLSAAGRSTDLAVLVARLPEDEEWLNWKKWLVEYQLMQRLDQDACSTVGTYITNTFDPYWHKLKVLCSAVQGNASEARFGADILAASGVEDPVFFALVDEMLTGEEASAFDPALIESLHIVLMDAAHHEIGLDGLGALAPGMEQGLVALRYLGSDARMVSTFDGLAKGLIAPQDAGDLWRSAATAPEPAQNALARHRSAASPLTTAMSWRAIAADKSAARLLLIAQAMKTDIANGNGLLMLPLYAELAREAANFPGIEGVASADDGQSLNSVAMLVAIDDPDHPVLQKEAFASPLVGDAAAMLQMLENGVWNKAPLVSFNLWNLLPVIEAAGVAPGDQEWLDLLDSQGASTSARSVNFVALPPLLMRAMAKSAEKRHVAETVLLASWVVGDTPLQMVNPNDVAQIVKAMDAIGQNMTGKAFAMEVVRAHLLARFHDLVPPMMAQENQMVDGDVIPENLQNMQMPVSPVTEELADADTLLEATQNMNEATTTPE